jgi:hypothetical protein
MGFVTDPSRNLCGENKCLKNYLIDHYEKIQGYQESSDIHQHHHCGVVVQLNCHYANFYCRKIDEVMI